MTQLDSGLVRQWLSDRARQLDDDADLTARDKSRTAVPAELRYAATELRKLAKAIDR